MNEQIERMKKDDNLRKLKSYSHRDHVNAIFDDVLKTILEKRGLPTPRGDIIPMGLRMKENIECDPPEMTLESILEKYYNRKDEQENSLVNQEKSSKTLETLVSGDSIDLDLVVDLILLSYKR